MTMVTSAASEVRTERFPCEVKACSEAGLANEATGVLDEAEAEANVETPNAITRRSVILPIELII